MNKDLPFSTIEELDLIRESVDLECKLALGKNKQGALPKDFWPTYSAMANTDGGLILLGIREKGGQLIPEGIQNVASVRKNLVDLLGNRQKVSINLLNDRDLIEKTFGTQTILVVKVPRANRKQKPVYIDGNPLNAFRRFDEADQRIPEDEVKLLLSEQSQESLDYTVLPQYGMHDLSIPTLEAYRRRHALREPEHQWNELDHASFLRETRAWSTNRDSGEEGLTVAGLLMFGKFQSIQDYFPNYALDYQERPEAKSELRWKDRVWLDGTWSGNLFDFYRIVFPKLTKDLKVPFKLKDGVRRGEDDVHEAIREAFANTLIHADYRQTCRILVVKRPDMLGFQNPGLMRIPIEAALNGDEPDARNKRLAHLFGFVGIGEKAGTGIPKIVSGWNAQHWRMPSFSEATTPSPRTTLQLQMLDLFPVGTMEHLQRMFGKKLNDLDHPSVTALAITLSEGRLTHSRLVELLDIHTSDATKALRDLVNQDYLTTSGAGRGTIYRFPGAPSVSPIDVFDDLMNLTENSPNLTENSPNLTENSPNLTENSPNLTENSPNLPPHASNVDDFGQSEDRDQEGRKLSQLLPAPIIDDLEKLSPSFQNELLKIAMPPLMKKRIPRQEMINVIVELCRGQFVRLNCLADLVGRKPETLRGQYLTELCANGTLKMAFEDNRNHPHQAYRSS